MTQIEIDIEDLSFHYLKTQALDGVDLQVERGQIFALLGPNGAGKTTLIDILLGLLYPKSGRARVLGKDVRALGPRDLAQIGYVNEEQEWPKTMTLGRLIRQLEPLYPTWDPALCADLIRRFDLRPEARLGGYSRGERMRVRLLLATVYRPRLLVLDEPFSGLDPMVREDVIDSMLDLTGERPWSILIATHEMATVERLADRIGFLADGDLWLDEDLDSLQQRCRHVRAELEAPLPTSFEWPATWLRDSQEGRSVSFLDTAAEAGEQDYAGLPALRSASTREASLEQIFIALHRQRKRPVDA